MATQAEIQIHLRYNERRIKESVASGIHMSIDDLKSKEIHERRYIIKEVAEPDELTWNIAIVPHYPRPVEFHVSTVAHVTTEPGLMGIENSSGFKGGERSGLLWWELVIGPEEIAAAEQRYLDKLFPDRSPDERGRQEPFLHNFTTSPVFKDASRYGNFRFSFSLADVLQAYRTQFCGGQSPILRVHETVMYKKEVMYSVLVHSPDVHDYDGYPELGDDDEGVCAYRNDEIIWRAQAISETHRFRLAEDRHERRVDVDDVDVKEFYVWDHVTLVFHIPKDTILEFPCEKLLKALSACEGDKPELNPPLISKREAEEILQEIKASVKFEHELGD